MGNGSSQPTQKVDPGHIEVYNKILRIKDPVTRVTMLQTCLSGPDFLIAAKKLGIYSGILQYISAVTYEHPGMHKLPGETGPGLVINSKQSVPMRTTASGASGAGESTVTMYTGNAEKAKDFFNYSLEVLGLRNSNAALTEDILKTAYKKAAAKAHPDKGGSPQKFKEVTKAHAYLMEVLTKIGGRAVTTGTVSTDRETYIRQEEDNKWANMQPVKLDPKNLNMSAFNDMFEKTRMAEPDEDGYGSWLRDGADDSNKITNNTSQSPRDLLAARERDRVSVAQVTRSGRGDGFNRDAFMRDFDDSLKSDSRYQSGALILNPNTMAIVAPVGTELGRDRPADFTAPFMSDVNYTDLRSAYGHHSTITNHVQNVQVNDRSYDSYKSSYESGPAALSAEELALMRRAEAEVEDREKARQMRHISQDQAHMDNAERIRRLVITNK